MLKLIIGNRAYSSWSFRGWLALRASGLEFEELVVPLYNEEWEKTREGDEFAPSRGKVPILLVHKMSQRQVLKEMAAHPLRHVETSDILPRQHIIVFEKKTQKKDKP